MACMLFNDDVWIADYRLTMWEDDHVGWPWKDSGEAVVTYFKSQYWHSPIATEESHECPQGSRCPAEIRTEALQSGNSWVMQNILDF
jgi:hypothetical protein